MANEYINREKLLKKINEYKNVTIWNTEELDAETIPRVLEVVENIVKEQEKVKRKSIDKARLIAIEFQIKHLEKEVEEDSKRYQLYIDTKIPISNKLMFASFLKGEIEERQQTIAFLKKLIEV